MEVSISSNNNKIQIIHFSIFSLGYALNPLNFQHFNFNYGVIKVNNTMVPSQPYTPDFQNGLFMREYKSLHNNTGIHDENIGTTVTRDLFEGGLFLQAYDLTPCQCSGFHTHAPLDGEIRLEMRFSTPLVEPVTIVSS